MVDKNQFTFGMFLGATMVVTIFCVANKWSLNLHNTDIQNEKLVERVESDLIPRQHNQRSYTHNKEKKNRRKHYPIHTDREIQDGYFFDSGRVILSPKYESNHFFHLDRVQYSVQEILPNPESGLIEIDNMGEHLPDFD